MIITLAKIVKRKSKTGYISEKTIYTSDDCSNCQHRNKCIRAHNCKTPLEERVKSLERIVSEEGCELRMNRSIQAEGSFAAIKQDMGFRRYLSKGKKNVLAESILLAMAHKYK